MKMSAYNMAGFYADAFAALNEQSTNLINLVGS